MNLHLFDKYHFSFFNFGLPFFIVSFLILVSIGHYAKNYLEGEIGLKKFWVLFTFFALGIVLCSISMNLETFFLGWEMVGLSSFFLIGFYPANNRSLENSLLALANYKMCDIFFVLAIFFEQSEDHFSAGLSLIIATLAKSAQFPFSSWLYKALEGPTPSSTAFYGGLSLHLGPFLLLQFHGLWDHYVELKILLGCIGITSAIYGLLVGSSRSDLKTSFAFASISQMGIIYLELAFGLYSLAMWHIAGHTFIRTWNYLRSASFFEDFFTESYHGRKDLLRKFFAHLPTSLYFHALNGFYLDAIFLIIRNLSLTIYLGASVYIGVSGVLAHQYNIPFILLIISSFLSVTYFIFPKYKLFNQLVAIIISQLCLIFAIFLTYTDESESLYFAFSILFLILLIYSIWPAINYWQKHSIQAGQYYLGLENKFPFRNYIYIISVISLTASPGSLQFFLQESLLETLWTLSHSYMVIVMIGFTLNAYHFFRIGQHAFAGSTNYVVENEEASLFSR